MIKINSELLKQFHQHGFSINEGVAVDARLVKSANRPLSNKKMKQLQLHLDSPEGRLDKNGKLRKYTRDHESNWVIKNDEHIMDLKSRLPLIPKMV